jgi:hypothetical protein
MHSPFSLFVKHLLDGKIKTATGESSTLTSRSCQTPFSPPCFLGHTRAGKMKMMNISSNSSKGPEMKMLYIFLSNKVDNVDLGPSNDGGWWWR